MTKSEILNEMHQLEGYIKERKLNLPEVLFLADDGCKTANERLDELQVMLDEQIAITGEMEAKEQMKIDASNLILTNLLDEIQEITDSLEKKSEGLHPMHRGRFLEVNKSLKQLLR